MIATSIEPFQQLQDDDKTLVKYNIQTIFSYDVN